MIWRGPERDVIPASKELGISQIVWSPLGQGILTGKYRPGEPPPGDSRAAHERMNYFMDRAGDQELLERVQELRPVADELGLSLAQLALAWVLREENVAAAIIGATRPEQVEDNAAASGVELDQATLERIDVILGDCVRWDGPASARD
jgi:aryl-alcohol dehydrogenase-like predicted oxidoreductase